MHTELCWLIDSIKILKNEYIFLKNNLSSVSGTVKTKTKLVLWRAASHIHSKGSKLIFIKMKRNFLFRKCQQIYGNKREEFEISSRFQMFKGKSGSLPPYSGSLPTYSGSLSPYSGSLPHYSKTCKEVQSLKLVLYIPDPLNGFINILRFLHQPNAQYKSYIHNKYLTLKCFSTIVTYWESIKLQVICYW